MELCEKGGKFAFLYFLRLFLSRSAQVLNQIAFEAVMIIVFEFLGDNSQNLNSFKE